MGKTSNIAHETREIQIKEQKDSSEAFKQAKELDPAISEAQVLSGKAYLDIGIL